MRIPTTAWRRTVTDRCDLMLNREQLLSGHVCRWQVAKTKQRIEEEKMQILVVERTQQIMLQEQEITRREKELEAKVKKPAEAERYRLEKLADAQRWVSRTPFLTPVSSRFHFYFAHASWKSLLTLFTKPTFIELRWALSNISIVKSYRSVH